MIKASKNSGITSPTSRTTNSNNCKLITNGTPVPKWHYVNHNDDINKKINNNNNNSRNNRQRKPNANITSTSLLISSHLILSH
ncbi:hypothetical protein OCU04_007407 [Sclerotinia nivalis]|uniref:Uncharacterized protein n=1 Tax=Sclerotinia nivalis TaxID=352851 RepID=A0A9X0AIY8_9HELO|nr:hypothetical protein OCU04_007407 [Sclerotinia nivalis]